MNTVKYFLIITVLLTVSNVGQNKLKTEADAEIVEYTNKDGLPTTNFSNIVQTNDGYLWISSIEGTYRFNGYEFEEVGEKYGVPKTQAIYYDSLKNKLYFASPKNFVVFDGNQFKTYGEKEGYKINGIEGQTVNFVRADSKEIIWIGSSTPYVDKEFNGGLTKFENGKFTVYDTTNFPLHNASTFFETPYGDLIFSSVGRNTTTGEGAYIALYKDGKFTLIDELKGVSLQRASFFNNDLNRIVDEDGNTWIAFNGVIRLGEKFSFSKSGVLMYDGSSFKEFPGIKSNLTNFNGISSVHYNSKNNKIYATTYVPNVELFNSNNKTIFEFNKDHWEVSNIIKKIGSIRGLKTGKELTNLPYVATLFVNSNSYFPDLLSFIVTDKVIGGQGSRFTNQFFTERDGKWLKVDASSGVPTKEIKDGLLMNTLNGFGIYYPKDYKVFTKEDGFLLPNSFIPNLYSDKNGIVWITYSLADLPAYVGLNSAGLNIWDGKRLHSITEKEGLLSNDCFDVFQDSQERIWIPSIKGVLICREIKNSKGDWLFKYEKIMSNKSKNFNSSKVIETSRGNIFTFQESVGIKVKDYKSKFYLGKFNGENFVEIPSPFDEKLKRKNAQFFQLRESPTGELLLEGVFADKRIELTTAKTHIMFYDGKNWNKAPDKWKVPEEHLYYVGTLQNGMYYLTINGFYNFNGKRFINLIDSVDANADFTLLKGASVAGTKTDNQADGKLFIRLRNRGLVIFDGKNLDFYTKKDGLPSANLYNPNPDSKGNMTFSHPSGALIVRDNKFQPYYDDASDITGGANVTTLDGFGNLVMHYKGIGLVVKKQDQKKYPLKLASIAVNDELFFYKFPDDLSYKENSVIFNFSVLNYKNPKQTNYEYRLEGYDKSWSKPGNLPFAQYQNLPPGDYNFRVKGITSNGIKTNEQSFAFVITPPFYNTWWAYLLYILSGILLLYSIRKFELKRQFKNAAIKESKLRAEAAELQAKAAEAQARVIQAENDRKSRELEEARTLQLSLLPKDLPKHDKLEIAFYMKTATEVGGDYYDYSFRPDGSLNIAIGDATGHGMKAGTLVSMMKSLFTANSIDKNLVDFFISSNTALKKSHMERMMIGFAMLNINDESAEIVNAGLPSLYHYVKSKNEINELDIHSLPLGAMSSDNYTPTTIKLAKDDVILMLTDGFPELQNKNEELYGYEKLEKSFEKVVEKSPNEIINYLVDEGLKWVEDKDPDDDVTFVVIKVK